MEQKDFEIRYHHLVTILKSELNPQGFWSGQLSSSALGTAVAIVALKIEDNLSSYDLIDKGLNWLFLHQDSDGGFGDTPDSKSNVSTSLLTYAAISYCKEMNNQSCRVLSKIEKYLLTQNIDLSKGDIPKAVLAYYGTDFTFSVPILSMMIICGVLDPKISRKIPQLPFELTLLPAKWYSFFNLRVVSYAIPALIGVGIFIFKTRKHHNPMLKWLRNKSIQPALRKLENILPESGGFLEAIPLTAFVSMCLISSGYGKNAIVEKGISFLRNQQRADGSWPIDTDLSTWVTTLSVKALGPGMGDEFLPSEMEVLSTYLKSIQYQKVHPFNLAMPGGWGWTGFTGSVPDVDDTSGAILALLELDKPYKSNATSIINGCQWLITLQNKDGGFPTFCKGWGKLPFDSSCADLTGHAFLALTKSLDRFESTIDPELRMAINQCISRAFGFLWKFQEDNGSWNPLWFGNQLTAGNKNPVYGTAKVSIYLNDSILCKSLNEIMKRNIGTMIQKATNFMIHQQNDDGSWGGELGIQGTIEETSLAISALTGKDREACLKGFTWLDVESNNNGLKASPIGLYFALLWYDEKLYPLIYYIEALRRFIL